MCFGVSIARTGEMIYGVGETPIAPGPDGKVIITREADEVFRPETIASFEGKSFTVMHPEDFVNPSNWKQLTHGVIQNVRRGKGEQESDLVADILVTVSQAIELVKKGIREVSCGYEAEYIETGVGRGIQKNIIGNHLALVAEGRAGEAYAINDHKGKGNMTIKDKIKAIFAKAQDEAMKAAETKDDMPDTTTAGSAPASGSYDELCKMVKDLSAKMDAMKPKDASSEPTQSEPAKVDAKDEPVAPSLEDRLKKMEDAVASLMQGQAAKDADGDEEEMEDGKDDEDKKDMKDGDDDEEAEMVGDSAPRFEILAPGLKPTGKDAKAQALKACYATKDGKTVIERFTGGKEVDYKNQILVESVFIGASEILKAERNKALALTKTFDFQNSSIAPKSALSADEINKKNEAHYAALAK